MAGTVIIAWDQPADTGGVPIIQYDIYRGTIIIATVSGDVLSYVDTGRQAGVPLNYAIRASNLNGPGPISGATTVTPVAPISVPDAPIFDGFDILPGVSGLNSGQIRWHAPANTGGSPIRLVTCTAIRYQDGITFDSDAGIPHLNYSAVVGNSLYTAAVSPGPDNAGGPGSPLVFNNTAFHPSTGGGGTQTSNFYLAIVNDTGPSATVLCAGGPIST